MFVSVSNIINKVSVGNGQCDLDRMYPKIPEIIECGVDVAKFLGNEFSLRRGDFISPAGLEHPSSCSAFQPARRALHKHSTLEAFMVSIFTPG